MKPEDKKIFYISITMVLFLGTISFWHFSKISLAEIDFSFPSYKEADIPKIDDLFSEESLKNIAQEIGLDQEKDEKDIVYTRKTVDNKIKFDYPSSWIVSEEENTIEKMKILFIAYADKAMYPPSIAVIKIEAENIDEVVEIFKEEIEKEGDISDLSLEETSETEHTLDISTEYPQKLTGSYQGKIFLIGEIYYMVSVMFFNEELSVPKNITDYIFSSIQIIE